MKKQNKKKENISYKQSEKISNLIAQIAGLTIKMQNLQLRNKELEEKVRFCEGHIREKKNKLNMIRVLAGPQSEDEKV